MLCSVCRRREVEVHEHTKLPLRPRLCGPCNSLERNSYLERERVAKSLAEEGTSFQEVFGREPGDPSFWLKPKVAPSARSR
jgi:hypothetical protein